jgi:hypothetical protein
MARSKALLSGWFRRFRREDPALQRFQSLAAIRQDARPSTVPVFGTQKA